MKFFNHRIPQSELFQVLNKVRLRRPIDVVAFSEEFLPQGIRSGTSA